MALWLGDLAALPEDSGQVLAPTWWLTTICDSISRGPDALLWPLQALHVHGAQTYTRVKHSYK